LSNLAMPPVEHDVCPASWGFHLLVSAIIFAP
jgi:hypothetical protein